MAHYGLEGQILLEKGRLRTLSSTVSTSQLELSSKVRNYNVHVGRIVPSTQTVIGLMARKCAYNTSRRGLSSCLS